MSLWRFFSAISASVSASSALNPDATIIQSHLNAEFAEVDAEIAEVDAEIAE